MTQRPIKFRVWNKKTKFMDDTPVVYKNAPGTIDTEGKLIWLSPEENYILMQFTGLLDKNGKEIYEGDIVGYWGGNPNGAKWIVGWDENKSGWSAVYGETDITSSGISMSGMPVFKLSKKLCLKKEILGNIYQNPELLK